MSCGGLMKITLDVSSISRSTVAGIRRLLAAELAVGRELEAMKVKYPTMLKQVSLRRLRREIRELGRAIRGLK